MLFVALRESFILSCRTFFGVPRIFGSSLLKFECKIPPNFRATWHLTLGNRHFKDPEIEIYGEIGAVMNAGATCIKKSIIKVELAGVFICKL